MYHRRHHNYRRSVPGRGHLPTDLDVRVSRAVYLQYAEDAVVVRGTNGVVGDFLRDNTPVPLLCKGNRDICGVFAWFYRWPCALVWLPGDRLK